MLKYNQTKSEIQTQIPLFRINGLKFIISNFLLDCEVLLFPIRLIYGEFQFGYSGELLNICKKTKEIG